MYNFGPVGDEDELVRFRGQKIKGQGDNDTTYGQISTLRETFSHLFPELIDVF